MSKDFIRIGGAREHNLRNVTVRIPRDKFTVITDISGSGKPSEARRSAEGDPNGRAESDERVQCTLDRKSTRLNSSHRT